MNYPENVQRGISYIEANLNSDIRSGDVARYAGISHWHFQRIFKALTNETLKTYIRSRRFADALDKLAKSDLLVIEIGLAAGFESQETFTRTFKMAFGAAPADYRNPAITEASTTDAPEGTRSTNRARLEGQDFARL